MRSFWRNLAHGRTVEKDLDDELRGYADLLSDEHRARGLSPDAAARAARLELGGLDQVKERVREVKAGAGLQLLWYDVRYGVRVLSRAPAFACAATVSVALGIGANSAIFGLVNAVQLSDLPVPHPEELAAVRLSGPRCCRHTGRNRQVSVPLWREIEQHQQSFSGLFAFADTRFNLAPRGEVRYVEGLYVSGDFFPVLGVVPALGRPLTRDDDRSGCANAPAVISHALWQSEFGGSPDVLTRTIRLRTSDHPIAGVMPPQFLGLEIGRRFEVALPLCASGFGRADHWWLALMGRLKPGSTVAQAGAHLSALGPRLLQAAVPPSYEAEQAKQFGTLKFSVHPARAGISPLREQYQEPLALLWAIAGLVLVAACANVASLSLVRTTMREAEFALRRALGASTLRLVRQLIVEGALIALGGAAAGVLLAYVAQRGILTLLSTSTDPVVLDLSPDWRVLGFTMLMLGTATIALALAPAVQISRSAHVSGGARSTPRRARVVAREVLVAVQVAMSVVLVSGALLFTLTARNLLAADRGFHARDLLFAHVFLTDADHAPETRAHFRRDLLSRFAAIPGIAGAAYAATPPLGGSVWGTVVSVPSADGIIKAEADRNEVSAGYFAVMQMPILRGREFTDSDTPLSQRVAVVNETFAARFFGGEAAIGRQFIDADKSYEIVGIVRDSKQSQLTGGFSTDGLFGGLTDCAARHDDALCDPSRDLCTCGHVGRPARRRRLVAIGERPLCHPRRCCGRVSAERTPHGQLVGILRCRRDRRGCRRALRGRVLHSRQPPARDRDTHGPRRPRIGCSAHGSRTCVGSRGRRIDRGSSPHDSRRHRRQLALVRRPTWGSRRRRLDCRHHDRHGARGVVAAGPARTRHRPGHRVERRMSAS